MNVKDAIVALGGVGLVGRDLSVPAKSVGMWGARDSVPARHMLGFWRLCIRAGIAWEPPGADAIRAQLGVPAPPSTPTTQAA